MGSGLEGGDELDGEGDGELTPKSMASVEVEVDERVVLPFLRTCNPVCSGIHITDTKQPSHTSGA